MIKRRTFLKAGLATSLAGPAIATNGVAATRDWGALFEKAGVAGTIVVHDERPGRQQYVYNSSRAQTQLPPASTFKVPHALIALDAGLVTDEFQTFRWDGREYNIRSWNQDQTLRSSMRYSALWVYQGFARSIGREAEQAYLDKLGYGNRRIGDNVDMFWVDGSLRISAQEQVMFLKDLYRNALPFSAAHQYLVKDILINEAQDDMILRAKTGWALRPGEAGLGWWIGWVEREAGPVFFALNIDMPRGIEDAPKRKSIVRDVLRDLKAL